MRTRRTLLVTLLLFAVAGCTSTHTRPIVDAAGAAVAGSVASLERIELGGVPQWILLRGRDAGKPLLLKLHGGPGQAEMATVALNEALERDFVVVEWDQRGAGKSAASFEPASAMTLEQIVADTLELTQRLLQRFGRKRLVLVGHSWGSVVGMKAVQRRPDLFQAFVSTGQIVAYGQGLALGHDFLLQEAARRGHAAALAELRQIGAPPYETDRQRETHVRWLTNFGAFWHADTPFDRVGWMLSAVEYAWPEKLRFPSAAAASFEKLLPDLLATDLAAEIQAVEVPVYFAVGRFDRMAPPSLAQAWFERLHAPRKHWIWFERSAHFPQWEEPDAFHALLVDRVLPETGPETVSR